MALPGWPRATVDLEAASNTDAGWWFVAVSDAFDFLEREHDYVLTKARYHQAGHYVRYRGTAYQITIEYEPEWGSLHSFIVLIEDVPLGVNPKMISILSILEARAPETTWHRNALKPGRSHTEIVETLKDWGQGLRLYAPDIVGGMPLEGLSWDSTPR